MEDNRMDEINYAFDKDLENQLMDKLVDLYHLKRVMSRQLIRLSKKDIKVIKTIYKNIKENRNYQDEIIEVIKEKQDYNLKIEDQEVQLSEEEILRIFVYLIDIYSPTYPLGTVVLLKKEHLHKLLENKEVDKVLMVITKRYIFKEHSKVYFKYVGSPYPIGSMGTQNDFHFTDDLIEEVVYEGYRDEQEDVFVYMMKKELIIEKDYKSIGYASQEEADELLKE